VVASGDPLLHGVGGALIRLYGADKVAVLPHVSSVTLACSRVGWAVQDTEIISLVTAEPHTAVRRGGQAVVMSRDDTSPAELAGCSPKPGAATRKSRCSNSSAARQSAGGLRPRVSGPPGHPKTSDALNVIAVRYLPDDRLFATLPDESFALDGQITKQSVRAVTMAALAARPGDCLGCRRWFGQHLDRVVRSGFGCRAVAFERDEQRRKRITENAAAFGARVEVHFDAPEAFDFVPPPKVVFIGGGLTQPDWSMHATSASSPAERLVANAVTAESEAVLIQWYRVAVASCGPISSTIRGEQLGQCSPDGVPQCP
jgi:precorrin-6Y C5,15-methyltransferase (decarboxylating)